jgi:DNA-directed RNA polymerase subunit RPC12/RpoP
MTTRHPDSGPAHINRFDGNALAGLLEQAFAADVTTARFQCGHCGTTAPLAEALVELSDTSAIALCRNCSHTLFTMLREGGSVTIDFAGLRRFVFD